MEFISVLLPAITRRTVGAHPRMQTVTALTRFLGVLIFGFVDISDVS